nr:Hypothetical protein CBG14703 [Haemonchus contortus]
MALEEPPPLPKKIRSCCLYKYPEWVQGMVGSEGKQQVRMKASASNVSLAPSGRFRPEHHNHQWPSAAPAQYQRSSTTLSGPPYAGEFNSNAVGSRVAERCDTNTDMERHENAGQWRSDKFAAEESYS